MLTQKLLDPCKPGKKTQKLIKRGRDFSKRKINGHLKQTQKKMLDSFKPVKRCIKVERTQYNNSFT